jgi:hypothetical protein
MGGLKLSSFVWCVGLCIVASRETGSSVDVAGFRLTVTVAVS